MSTDRDQETTAPASPDRYFPLGRRVWLYRTPLDFLEATICTLAPAWICCQFWGSIHLRLISDIASLLHGPMQSLSALDIIVGAIGVLILVTAAHRWLRIRFGAMRVSPGEINVWSWCNRERRMHTSQIVAAEMTYGHLNCSRDFVWRLFICYRPDGVASTPRWITAYAGRGTRLGPAALEAVRQACGFTESGLLQGFVGRCIWRRPGTTDVPRMPWRMSIAGYIGSGYGS